MKGIIVAAGRGNRLMPLTKDRPKSLVLLKGKPIIEYALDSFSDCGIREVVVVVGYYAEKHEKVIGRKYKNCNIIYCVNEDYASTDNMTSLFMAKDYIADGFIFLNADVVFSKTILAKLIDDPHQNVIVADTEKALSASVMKLKVVNDKLVKIDRNLIEGNGRAIGMYKFSPRGARLYFEEIEKLIKMDGKKMQIEQPLSRFIEANKMYVLKTNGLPWCEIDNERDLKMAERMLSQISA